MDEVPWDEGHPFYNMTADEFFGQNVTPDLSYWTKTAYWTVEEGVALSFGMEPRIVNWDVVRNIRGHPFIKTYKERLSLALRATEMGQLNERADPLEFVQWMDKIGLDFDAEVEEAVRQRLRSRTDNTLGEKIGAEAGQEYRDLSPSANPTVKGESGGDLGTKARTTLLKMILGMAMDKYRYDPKATRQRATVAIADALERRQNQGLKVGDDTVRTWLATAVDEVWINPEEDENRKEKESREE